ncbi:MAG: hypothetical protein ABTS22_06620 [Accumulibacter sp.]|uniref:hypothetical protein n=1 Tax=Accumulibacter sp. TaxID=2053492 RepID=UPI001AC42B19|nr:hypothetical protein [Accumulibacter sp.]MBN8437973.1 hypothetical protein [Accumulibacter sp.]
MSETHPLDTELRDLWIHRRDLDEAGWTRLHAIAMTVLMNYKPRELAGLPEDREVYIAEFFQDKVFRLDSLSRCDHVGALRLYYQRYLRDLLRSKLARASHEVADEHDPERESPPSLDEAPDAAAARLDPFVELAEAGFAPTEVAASASAWLAASEEWVRLFVALSNCPDATSSEPLVRLARRKSIKSQAYKAEKLGFNWRGGNVDGFAGTLLGRWIVDALGIELIPENSPLILGVLKILCFEALSWAEQQEAAT